jgi:Pyruvate/2-oxoacid:ferredoxin oxidoreductase delta subunit/flavodoxin
MSTQSTEIFYFSATGNSLALARDIAKKLNGKLVSIPAVMNKKSVQTDADVIGIVFPVYYASNDCGIPLIVERFVKKLEGIGSKYVFGVCTHSAMPRETIKNLRKLIKSRGGELAAGFTLWMGSKKLTEKEQQKLFITTKKKADAICEYVAARRSGKFETCGLLRKIFYAPVLFLLIKPVFSRRYRNLSNIKQHLPFSELVPFADRSFQCDDTKCSGCGICAQVCPVNNIKMVNNRPMWQHHCETCYACYVWCPNGAIHGDIVKYNERRHHPDVELSDMIRRK